MGEPALGTCKGGHANGIAPYFFTMENVSILIISLHICHTYYS